MAHFELIVHDLRSPPLQIINGRPGNSSYPVSSIKSASMHPQMDPTGHEKHPDISIQVADTRINGKNKRSHPHGTAAAHTTNTSSFQANILVVEDEGIVALDIKNTLNRLGHHVTGVASTGWDAIHQALKTNPDIVLMDIRLHGEMDGIEAAASIRQKLDIPVIFLTAQADTPTRQRAESVSPVGYLIKPFSTQELEATLSIALIHQENDQSDA